MFCGCCSNRGHADTFATLADRPCAQSRAGLSPSKFPENRENIGNLECFPNFCRKSKRNFRELRANSLNALIGFFNDQGSIVGGPGLPASVREAIRDKILRRISTLAMQPNFNAFFASCDAGKPEKRRCSSTSDASHSEKRFEIPVSELCRGQTRKQACCAIVEQSPAI